MQKLFHVRLLSPHGRNNDPMAFMMSMLPMMEIREYNRWQHHVPPSLSYTDLIPRQRLQTWLYRLFLKVALPPTRPDIVSNQLIYSPLNLSFFFRLCTHLCQIGYPAHWLGEVASSILSGTITTRARPPRSEPLSRREIDTAFPVMAQSVQPFVAEFSTLVAMWQLVLPFGIISPDIAPVETIKRYSVTMKSASNEVDAWPVFILVFYDGSLRPSTAIFDLRSCLLSDEKALKDNDTKKFRDGNISIVTSWEWNATSKKATFWLRSDVMRTMGERQWEVCIYRADNWRPQSKSYDVKECCVEGVSWVQWVNNGGSAVSATVTDSSADAVEDEKDDREDPD